MLFGVLFGFLFSQFEWGKSFVIDWVKPFGTIFINVLKLIAVPLILASLIKGVSDLKNIAINAINPTISNFTLSDNNNLAPVLSYSVNDGDIATIGFQSDKELLVSSLTATFTGFSTTVTKTVSGSGPYDYEISFYGLFAY